MATLLRTLIVEDSAVDAELLVIALHGAGFELEWKRVDREQELAQELNQPLDIVFSDFSMPGLSVFRVLQLMRDRKPDIPCIIVSGTIGEEQVVETLKCGAVDYVLKDRLDRLSLVVSRALRESHERAGKKEAERQLHIRTMALEAADNGILIADTTGKILWANAVFSQAGVTTLQEALKHSTCLHPSTEQECSFEELWRTISAGNVWRGGLQSQPDRPVSYEEITITPVRVDGNAITHFIAVKQDLTEHRRAKTALQTATEQLNRLLAHSPAVIYSLRVDQEGFIPVWVSENIRHLFGYNPDEVCYAGWWLEHVHPEDRRLLADGNAQLKTTGHAIHEYRFRHQDGSFRWISDEKRLVRDSQGEPTEVVGVWTDITERKGLEAQLRQAQKLESIGQLAGGIAHDFNNILTVIQGHASLLLSNRALSDSTLDSAQQIAFASERAANLTRQLLTFSRKQVMQPRALNLNDIVGNMMKMLRRILREDVTLKVNCASNSAVHADAGMLEQVLMNLAVNARDAMPNGGELIISTSDERIGPEYLQASAYGTPGDFVCLSVSDTGCGIPPDVLPRIFEPFFTTKAVGQGTGLGLATVYGIVHQHRGWIKVYSEPGSGTTFRIYLPVLREVAKNKVELKQENDIQGGSETILLVEDEDAVRTLARNLLERKGYNVIEASTAVEALKIWKSNPRVDLVLTDMVMPGGMTGLDLMRKIHEEAPSLPAIYASGYSVDIVGKDFELKDGINFLQKPYGPRRLAQTVRDALDQRPK